MSTLDKQPFLIVAVDKFSLATRDSGYKDTSSAVAEVKAAQGRDTFTLICAVIEPKAYDGRIQR
jgi:hypothetical protein